jgi:hypothetical protein
MVLRSRRAAIMRAAARGEVPATGQLGHQNRSHTGRDPPPRPARRDSAPNGKRRSLPSGRHSPRRALAVQTHPRRRLQLLNQLTRRWATRSAPGHTNEARPGISPRTPPHGRQRSAEIRQLPAPGGHLHKCPRRFSDQKPDTTSTRYHSTDRNKVGSRDAMLNS